LIEPRESDSTARKAATDPSALGVLYEAHRTLVFNVCFRMLGDWQEAENLTQDVFLRAYKSLHQLRGEARVSTWLYRVAVNLCLNHQRRQRRERWLSLDWLFESQGESASSLPVEEKTPRTDLEERESAGLVQSAIQALPERQRAALVLHLYERLSYQEIAAVMQCSVASVESRLHRAKQNLAKNLLERMK